MSDNKEAILTGYPNIISYGCTKKIIKQMETSICKINIEPKQGTGFFCKIPFPDEKNMLPVFITNNHVINKDFLFKENAKIEFDIEEENDPKIINLYKRLKYTNEDYDTTIIEIKEKDNIKNYLELDDNIMEDILNDNNRLSKYKSKTIYIIQYPKGDLSVSYGILNQICEDKKYNFNHKCSTEGGSSGSPILNINNKLIGIHRESHLNNANLGTFLNYPIKEFIKLNYNKNENETKEFDIKSHSDIEENNLIIEQISTHDIDGEISNNNEIYKKELLSSFSIIESKETNKIDNMNSPKLPQNMGMKMQTMEEFWQQQMMQQQ